jgi:alpha-L-arabinofuranosidase
MVGSSNLKANLKIDENAALQPYDRKIFGLFIEHFHRQIYGGIFCPESRFSDDDGFRVDVIEALRELRVPIVRWPGGCFASAYHWINGVGKTRTPAYDKAWHVEDPNTFGTREFITWCRKIGAEPYICTNAGTGTPEEMSNWVEYCNLREQGTFSRARAEHGHPDPYDVKNWSIGNENYGDWEMGAKTVDEWGLFVKESAKLMVNVDHSIKLLAAALPDRKWTIPLLKRAGKYLDYVSIHGYWDSLWAVDKPSDFITCMMRTGEPEQQIRKTIGILDETDFSRKIKIAFDEWNLRGWHHPGLGDREHGQDIQARDRNDIDATYTMADALFSACFLNSCLRNARHVAMACMAPGVNARGPLHVHPEGLIKRTTYHVMYMYANLLQDNVMPSSVKSGVLWNKKATTPAVDTIVTSSNDKKAIVIALVNKHPGEIIDCCIDLPGIPKDITATLLAGDSVDAYNGIDSPERVIPEKRKIRCNEGHVTLPAHSLVFLSIER